ncbi:heavy metal translocating P-type ATPase [Ottowia sp.]|uniref:heavy metal translocating P-type ATPase n=1 Tax=Ottowia sp. TaxID=1898956 RepID=UPI003A84B063
MVPSFALLDERDEWMEFSRPLDGAPTDQAQRWESTVVFGGMHCAACAVTIEEALRTTPGVLEADVNAASHRGRVVWDEAVVKPSGWMQAAQGVGYAPLPANNALASSQRQAETRKMAWRLGVAGLCMMQVMMYATPSYFTAPGEIEDNIIHLLRWAQWVLSVPVILFSCQPFFGNALRDLRLRRVSMDLPVALGMAIAFVVSSLGTFEPEGVFGHEVYFDSLTMFVFFLLAGRWLELRLRDRTAGALEALMHRLPDSVERRTSDGRWERVAARRVRVGDVVRVRPGESFPADGTLVSGGTSVDEALLTGESTPLARGVGAQVIAGSHNLTSTVEVQVNQVGSQTRYAQIVALMAQAATSRPQMAQLADRLAKPFLLLVLLAAGLACAWWWHTDPERALMIAVAILVVTCPCALSLATPAAMLASAGTLARQGVLVRRLQALETLASVDEVIFDKTGTLTRDAFVLKQVVWREDMTRDDVLGLAAAVAGASLHPVSRAVVHAAAEQGLPVEQMAVQHAEEVAGQGVAAQVIDVAGKQLALRLGSAAFCGVTVPVQDGLGTHLSDARGWLASFYLHEEVRGDARATINAFERAKVHVRLLSGDGPEAVARVGQQLGVKQALGGCSPSDKLSVIHDVQRAGGQVAMVGDGLNDGPVLAGANVSFAFGRAVPLTQAQADVVVLSENLSAIVTTYRKAGKTMQVVRQNLLWAGIYNAVGVPLAVMGWMPAWAAGLGMAGSSLVVVLNALRLSKDDTLST